MKRMVRGTSALLLRRRPKQTTFSVSFGSRSPLVDSLMNDHLVADHFFRGWSGLDKVGSSKAWCPRSALSRFCTAKATDDGIESVSDKARGSISGSKSDAIESGPGKAGFSMESDGSSGREPADSGKSPGVSAQVAAVLKNPNMESHGSSGNSGKPPGVWAKVANMANMVIISVIGLFFYLVYELVSIGMGWNVPVHDPHFQIPVQDKVEGLRTCMEAQWRAFFIVLGLPNIGKTTTVCKAAKGLPAIYIDCQSCESLDQLNTTILKSQSWFLNVFAIRRSMESLATLGSICRWIYGKKLVVILDHLHRLDTAATYHLLSWAKANAEADTLAIFLVGSDASVNLLGTMDSDTRGELVIFAPFSEDEIVEGVIDHFVKHEGMVKEDKELQGIIRELIYWYGPCPNQVLKNAKVAMKGDLRNMLGRAGVKVTGMHGARGDGKRVDDNNVDFWYELACNGRVAVDELEHLGVSFDVAVQDPCLHLHMGSLYFRNGFCRDYHIAVMSKNLFAKANISWKVQRSSLLAKRDSLEKCRLDHRLATYSPTHLKGIEVL